MSQITMFWTLTVQENDLLCVRLDKSAAEVVTINGRVVVEGPCLVSAISPGGIHFSDGGPVVPIAGLFLDEKEAGHAALIPRSFQSLDDWFADQTEEVLQAIGWNNPLIKLVWEEPSGRVLADVERRFCDRLPDFPPSRRA